MSTSDLDELRNSVEEYLRIGPAQSMLLDTFEAAVDAKARADERERIAKAIEDQADCYEIDASNEDNMRERAVLRAAANLVRSMADIARNDGSRR